MVQTVYNMFGDVTGFVDSIGKQVITYLYDSCGVPVFFYM